MVDTRSTKGLATSLQRENFKVIFCQVLLQRNPFALTHPDLLRRQVPQPTHHLCFPRGLSTPTNLAINLSYRG